MAMWLNRHDPTKLTPCAAFAVRTAGPPDADETANAVAATVAATATRARIPFFNSHLLRGSTLGRYDCPVPGVFGE
jgi:hypothetical protein